jgi:hypothetical protein
MMLVLVNGQCLQESLPFGYWLLAVEAVAVQVKLLFGGHKAAAAVL